MGYKVKGRRVTKLRQVRTKDGRKIQFLGQSARGTVVMLGSVSGAGRDAKAILAAADKAVLADDKTSRPAGL